MSFDHQKSRQREIGAASTDEDLHRALTSQTMRLSLRIISVALSFIFGKKADSPMARTPQDITDAELAVLTLLWEQGRCTVRYLTDTIYPGGSGAHYATVQKLLERLENKKFIK